MSCATTRCTCGEVLAGVRGQRAVELAQRLRRRQRLGALDHLALELAADVLLELLQAVARDRVRVGLLGFRASPLAGRGRGGCAGRPPRSRRSPRPGGRRRRSPAARGRASRRRAAAHRLADALAQRLEVDAVLGARALLAQPCSIASRSTARKKKRSKSTSRTWRSSCDLASVAASASRKSGARSSSRPRAPGTRRAARSSRRPRPRGAARPRARAAAAPSRRAGAAGIPPYSGVPSPPAGTSHRPA